MRLTKYHCPKGNKSGIKGITDQCMYEGFMDRKSDLCINCGVSYNETRTIWHKIYMAIPYWLRRPFRSPWRDMSRFVRFAYQRETRGFDDSELWSLDYTIAKFMAPRLLAFIDFQAGVPGALHPCNDKKTIEQRSKEWKKILRKMQQAFQLIVDSDGATYILTKKEQKAIEDGLDLFREYFFNLWD